MDERRLDSTEQIDLEKKTLGQRLFDNRYPILILSALISFVLYNLWGLIETMRVSSAP